MLRICDLCLGQGGEGRGRPCEEAGRWPGGPSLRCSRPHLLLLRGASVCVCAVVCWFSCVFARSVSDLRPRPAGGQGSGRRRISEAGRGDS